MTTYIVSDDNVLRNALQSIHPLIVSSVDEISESEIKAIVLDKYCNHNDINKIRSSFPTSFICIYNPDAYDNPNYRISTFGVGVNQVAYDTTEILSTLVEDVLFLNSDYQTGNLTCPYCGLQGLSEDGLWRHCPAYHINWTRDSIKSNICPICQLTFARESLQSHIHEKHGPIIRAQTREERHDSRLPNQLYNFSLVVCRHPHTGKFLLCQEFCNQGFWLPGGAVDSGEGLKAAAIRETLEEAGLDVELKGILAIEYHPCGKQQSNDRYLVRMRVIFYAEPTAEAMYKYPKSRPDYESCGACWASIEDICDSNMKLRGNEPVYWAKYLQNGGVIYPLDVLQERHC